MTIILVRISLLAISVSVNTLVLHLEFPLFDFCSVLRNLLRFSCLSFLSAEITGAFLVQHIPERSCSRAVSAGLEAVKDVCCLSPQGVLHSNVLLEVFILLFYFVLQAHADKRLL